MTPQKKPEPGDGRERLQKRWRSAVGRPQFEEIDLSPEDEAALDRAEAKRDAEREARRGLPRETGATMTVFLTRCPDGTILAMARAESDGGVIGDLRLPVRPGGQFLGWSYDELAALGEGRHEMTERPAAARPPEG